MSNCQKAKTRPVSPNTDRVFYTVYCMGLGKKCQVISGGSGLDVKDR